MRLLSNMLVIAAVVACIVALPTAGALDAEESEENITVTQNSTKEESNSTSLKIPPMKLDEDVACSACDHVVNRIYTAIQKVSEEDKKQPLKVRKDIAMDILKATCYSTKGMLLEGSKGSRKFAYPMPPSTESEETDDDENSDEEEKKAKAEAEKKAFFESLEEGPVDRTLRDACIYMMGSEGWKLRSRIAGFYKETTSYSLKKRLCINSLNLCQPPRASRLKKHEKCLMSAYNAIGRNDWKTAMDKIDCAKDLTGTSSSAKKSKRKKKKSKKNRSDSKE
eukprot:g2736.t1